MPSIVRRERSLKGEANLMRALLTKVIKRYESVDFLGQLNFCKFVRKYELVLLTLKKSSLGLHYQKSIGVPWNKHPS